MPTGLVGVGAVPLNHAKKGATEGGIPEWHPGGTQVAPRWHPMAPSGTQWHPGGTQVAPRWHPSGTFRHPGGTFPFAWHLSAPSGRQRHSVVPRPGPWERNPSPVGSAGRHSRPNLGFAREAQPCPLSPSRPSGMEPIDFAEPGFFSSQMVTFRLLPWVSRWGNCDGGAEA
jgi:hypothetical protein